MADKNERTIKIQKIGIEKVAKSSSHSPNCYAPPPPPPPPFGEEDGWDLQFCKWWGWNWVKKENNALVGATETENIVEERSLKQQTSKRARGAGDVSSHKSKHDKGSYFKQLRSLFSKIKQTSSLQKLFNTPSVSHCCYHATCEYDLKKKISEPVSCSKGCLFDDKEQTIQTWSKDEIDSYGSTCIVVCPSMKEIESNRLSRKHMQSDIHVTKTNSSQQTQDVKRGKKKTFYHLVCSGCYPQICCCRCHKQVDTKEIQHSSHLIETKPKDRSHYSRRTKSTTNQKDNISGKKLCQDHPPSFLSHQHLPHDDTIYKKRPNSFKQCAYRVPSRYQMYQVTPVQLQRHSQDAYNECLGSFQDAYKDASRRSQDVQKDSPKCSQKFHKAFPGCSKLKRDVPRYPQDKDQQKCSHKKEHSNCCRHGTHPLCTDHYQKNIPYDKCLYGKNHPANNEEFFVEKEHASFADGKINEEPMDFNNKFPYRARYDTKVNIHSNSKHQYNQQHTPQSVFSEQTSSDQRMSPERPFDYEKSEEQFSDKFTTDKYSHQYQNRNYQEGEHWDYDDREYWRQDGSYSKWNEKPNMKSQSYPEWPECKDLLFQERWSPCSRRPPFQDRKRQNTQRRHQSPYLEPQKLYQNLFSRQAYQKMMPFLEKPSNEKWATREKKRPPHPTYCLYNPEDIPCKKARMCDIPEKDDPYKTYRDWNRVTFAKNVFPKFGACAQKYPQMQNTKSDILDKYYSFKLEEEFFSPLSGKRYNLTPRSVVDRDCYTSSSLPDPMEVEDDLKYLESLDANLKVDRNSCVMLDAMCDAILYSNSSSKELTAESTLIRKFSYPQCKGTKSEPDTQEEHNQRLSSEWKRFPDDCPQQPSANFEISFVQRIETMINNILNSKMTQNDSQISSGNSFAEQVNKFNNLFEKMDEITKKSKANVEKIQEVMYSLPEDFNRYDLKRKSIDSTDQEYSCISLDLPQNVPTSFIENEPTRSNDFVQNIIQTFVKRSDKKEFDDVLDSTDGNNRLKAETCTFSGSEIKGNNKDMNSNVADSQDIRQQINLIFKKFNNDVKMNHTTKKNSNSFTTPSTRFKTKDFIRNRRLRTKVVVKKKTKVT